MADLVHLALKLNTYLLFNSDIMNFVRKTDEEEEAESIVLLIFVLWQCFNILLVRVVRWGRNSYLGPAKITSFSSLDLSRSNKHDAFWHVVSTGYFYVLFSSAIAVSNFLPLET